MNKPPSTHRDRVFRRIAEKIGFSNANIVALGRDVRALAEKVTELRQHDPEAAEQLGICLDILHEAIVNTAKAHKQLRLTTQQVKDYGPTNRPKTNRPKTN